MVDMIHCKFSKRTLAAVLIGCLATAVFSSRHEASANDDDAIPPLSVESLYHPKQRFDYVESPTPATRWIRSADGRPLLLIRRDRWMQIDPEDLEASAADEEATDEESDEKTAGEEAAAETPWPGFDELVQQLVSLGDIDEKAAESAVNSWISSDKSLDAALLRIDNGLVLAGREQTPRRLTRHASSWNEATLSPDGSRVAFVRENDLYVFHLATDRLIRLTDDGSPTRLNGRLDWVYQEEIYGRGNFRAFWWCDDSRSLAFLRLDNFRVRPFTITVSGSPRGSLLVERYPKAGDDITAAELWAASIPEEAEQSATVFPVYAPPADQEMLIVRVGWKPKTRELVYEVTNRLQNESTLWQMDLDANPREPVRLLREQSDRWLEVIDLPQWLPSGDFLRLSDLPAGRRRLWRISGDGGRQIPLTPPDFDVRELVAVDNEAGTAYLTGDLQRGTVGQQLYLVDIERSGDASRGPLVQATFDSPWHRVSLSDDHRWMIDRASSLSEPTVMSLRRCNGRADAPSQRLHRERLRLPGEATVPQWLKVQTEDGPELAAYVFPPAGVSSAEDDDEGNENNARFPLLVEIYGGPLAPSVRDSWSSSRYLLHQMLSQRGIGVAVIDNRSSGGRGLADAWSIHRRVGEVEARDVAATVETWKSFAWVDPDRLAVRGWSFGGFLTLKSMTGGEDFAAGVAGGSVTDWRNYDAIYTERYMGLPAENPAGYDATSPVKSAGKLHGRVLLIHGEVDDNVHLSNTLQMAAALQEAGKPFELMIYPDAAHGVHRPMQVYHLMRTTVEFLERQLKPQ